MAGVGKNKNKNKNKTLAVFGATGSIGASTLDLVRQGGFMVEILTGGSNVARLIELAKEFRPRHVAIADDTETKRDELRAAIGSDAEIHTGADAIAELAKTKTDVTVAAITGMAGLIPVLNAASRGGVVAVANKESLVAAGALIRKAAADSGATLLPVDSEHNAIHQAMRGHAPGDVARIILTASGGPFWGASLDTMRAATPAEAMRHPNWDMGAKVSVDSATMMNKGLEVIEAGVLFDLPEDRVDVLVHRQSLVHGMVCFRDGSVLAQMGDSDMRVPIAYCLGWPDRIDREMPPLTADALAGMTFEAPPDAALFPCLELAREAARMGGLAPCALNAANEIAVAAFLRGAIGFLDIAAVNRDILESIDHPRAGPAGGSLEDVLDHDARIRALSREQLKKVS